MKNILLLLILVIFRVPLFSQSIVDTGKLWNNAVIRTPFGNIFTENIRFTSDTIIQAQTFKKVERSLDSAMLNWSGYGYIREDINQRIYYRMNATEPERLLYDFGLTNGDSVRVYGLNSSFNTVFLDSMMYHVTSTDSVLVGNNYNRELHMSVRYDTSLVEVEQWVDSMGSMSGMLHNYDGLIGYDSYHILCFSVDGILEYHNPNTSTCYVVMSIGSGQADGSIVTISPNPVSDVSTLTIGGKDAGEWHMLDLFNSLGQKVLDKKFTRVTQIYRNQLSPGIYFYKIYFKSGKIASGKLVVN